MKWVNRKKKDIIFQKEILFIWLKISLIATFNKWFPQSKVIQNYAMNIKGKSNNTNRSKLPIPEESEIKC